VQLDKKKIWADELVWDNKNLTFYDADQETKKNKKAEFYVEKKIYQTRLDFSTYSHHRNAKANRPNLQIQNFRSPNKRKVIAVLKKSC
jgi:hypothetical protein